MAKIHQFKGVRLGIATQETCIVKPYCRNALVRLLAACTQKQHLMSSALTRNMALIIFARNWSSRACRNYYAEHGNDFICGDRSDAVFDQEWSVTHIPELAGAKDACADCCNNGIQGNPSGPFSTFLQYTLYPALLQQP